MSISETSTTSFEKQVRILAELYVLITNDERINQIQNYHASSLVFAYHYVMAHIPMTPYMKDDIQYGYESFITKFLGFGPAYEGDPWPLKFENLAEVLARRAELDAEEADR